MEITYPLPTDTLAILSRLSQVIQAFIASVWNYRMPRHDTAWGIVPAIDFSIISRVRSRMGLAERALKSLMLRFHAGKLHAPRPRGPQANPRTHTPPKQKPLPRHFGWLCPLMPAEAVSRGHYLMQVLAEPEMQALLAASPRAVAILKPICRMLAIDPRVLTPAVRIGEAQSAVATLPHTEATHPRPAIHISSSPNPPLRPG